MPGGDRTGPVGRGPMTGWGAGYCAGYSKPGFVNSALWRLYGFRRRIGAGFRRGRGRRWAYPEAGYEYRDPYWVPDEAVPTREEEIDALREEAKCFEDALADINKRISNLEAQRSRS